MKQWVWAFLVVSLMNMSTLAHAQANAPLVPDNAANDGLAPAPDDAPPSTGIPPAAASPADIPSDNQNDLPGTRTDTAMPLDNGAPGIRPGKDFRNYHPDRNGWETQRPYQYGYRIRNFSGEHLPFARFARQDLMSAIFHGAILTNADFRSSNLSGADFANANLMGADLRAGRFLGADFRGTDLTNAHIHGADFGNALFNRNTKFPSGFIPEKAGMRFVP